MRRGSRVAPKLENRFFSRVEIKKNKLGNGAASTQKEGGGSGGSAGNPLGALLSLLIHRANLIRPEGTGAHTAGFLHAHTHTPQ